MTDLEEIFTKDVHPLLVPVFNQLADNYPYPVWRFRILHDNRQFIQRSKSEFDSVVKFLEDAGILETLRGDKGDYYVLRNGV